MSRAERILPALLRRRWLLVLTGTFLAVALVVLSSVVGVRPAEATSTLFSSGSTPASASDDPDAVTVGVAFTVRRAGTVRSIRYFKGASNTGPHEGGLFDASGTLLARTTFASESASGWQSATLAQPVAVDAGAKLVAAVLMPHGHYAFDHQYAWPAANDDLAGEQGRFHYGSDLKAPDKVYLGSNYWVDVTFEAAGQLPQVSSSPAAPAQPADAPSASSAPVSGSCVGAKNTPGGADPWGGCWPGPQNTGYPHGLAGDTRKPVTLTPYTGPSTIKSCGTVIDSKIVTGDLVLTAGNGSHDPTKPCLTVQNSLVLGVVHTDDAAYGPLVVTDTEIALDGLGWWENLGRYNTFAWRVDSHGSEGVIKCADYCEAHDSYVHGMTLGGSYHYNAFGSNGMEAAGGYFLVDHSWASCGDWVGVGAGLGDDAGCSADVGFYGDFDPIRNVTLSRNFFAGMRIDSKIPGARDRQPGYCLNPGYYPGKPYPRPTNVKVLDNVFGRGSSGKCGVFGPTNSLNAVGDRAGNEWERNTYDDGQAIGRPEE